MYVFAFSSVITFGDFTIISFFKNQNFETLPSLLFKLISAYRFNEASFVAGFILVLSLIIYFFIDIIVYKLKPAKIIWTYILAMYPKNITGVHFRCPKKV